MRLKSEKRKGSIYDLSEVYEKLGITGIEDKDVYAMVPVEFSYSDSRFSNLQVSRYAPVRSESELEKFMKELEKVIKNTDAVKEIRASIDMSKFVIDLSRLDTVNARAFVLERDNRSVYEKMVDNVREFFGQDRKSTKGTKLYLDSLKDLEKIDWNELRKDYSRREDEKERVFFIETEPAELTKDLEKEEEKEKEHDEREKEQQVRIPRKSVEEVKVAVLGTSLVFTGGRDVADAVKSRATESGLSASQDIGVTETKKEVKEEAKKNDRPSAAPTVSRNSLAKGKQAVRNNLRKTKDNVRGGRN